MKRHTDFYKAMRNLLFNELGVSRKMIDELVTERVNEAVKERLDGLFETKAFQRFLADVITNIVGSRGKYWRQAGAFEEFFRTEASAAAARFCREHLKVEWKDSP